MKRCLLIVSCLIIILIVSGSVKLHAQVRKPFEQRTSQYTPTKKIYNIKGNFTMIGNTNLTLVNYGDNANNSGDMVYVDVDGDSNTLNSSSATLTFSEENGAKPQCSHIVYAGLYWTGRAHSYNSPMSFTVTEMGTVPHAVDVGFTLEHNGDVPYSDYSLEIKRDSYWNGSSYSYRVNYVFTASGKPEISFRFYDDNDIYYSIEGGVSSVQVTGKTISPPSDIRTATFNPVTIYSKTGGIVLTIDELKRGSGTRQWESYYQDNSEASGHVSGFVREETGNVTKTYNKREIYLKKAGDSEGYQKFTARIGDIYYPSNSESNIYSAYVEVTDYVQENGIGEYFVADMALREGSGGNTGYSGGWGLVVVYENSRMKWRDVTIFDGYAYVKKEGSGETAYDLPISGFEAVQSGNVNVKLGLMASEGDVDIDGDFIKIQNADGSNWTSLSHDGNGTNNFFNSSVTTGGNDRNPNIKNNTGLDISMFSVPNDNNANIANKQTSTTFRYGTTQDTYAIFALAMAVDAYVPEAVATNAVMTIDGSDIVDGSTVLPGQEIKYRLDIRNRGTEIVSDARLVLPIPYTTDYVSSSQEVFFTSNGSGDSFDPTEGANGSVIWDIGDLPIPTGNPDEILGTLIYTVKVTEDCTILGNPNCDPSVAVGAGGGSSGTGATSGTTISGFSFIQGYESSGDCIGEPIVTPIEITIDAEDYVKEKCDIAEINTEKNYSFCNQGTSAFILITEIDGYFPDGCRFYDDYPVVDGTTLELTIADGFPTDSGTKTYYAVPPGYTSCYYTFKITVKNINSIPVVEDVNCCQGVDAAILGGNPSVDTYDLYFYTEKTGGTAQINITPSTDVVGPKIYYVAEGESSTCISPRRVPMTVTVNPKPRPIGIFFE